MTDLADAVGNLRRAKDAMAQARQLLMDSEAEHAVRRDALRTATDDYHKAQNVLLDVVEQNEG